MRFLENNSIRFSHSTAHTAHTQIFTQHKKERWGMVWVRFEWTPPYLLRARPGVRGPPGGPAVAVAAEEWPGGPKWDLYIHRILQ